MGCMIVERGVVSLGSFLSSAVAGRCRVTLRELWMCKGTFFLGLVSIGNYIPDGVGGLYMEGVVLGCTSLVVRCLRSS